MYQTTPYKIHGPHSPRQARCFKPDVAHQLPPPQADRYAALCWKKQTLEELSIRDELVAPDYETTCDLIEALVREAQRRSDAPASEVIDDATH